MIGSEEHQQLNLEVAREAVALLKNNGSLPFNAAGAKRIAVVGPLADDAQTQLGDWAGSSGQINWMPDGHPREMITTVLDASSSSLRKLRGRVLPRCQYRGFGA